MLCRLSSLRERGLAVAEVMERVPLANTPSAVHREESATALRAPFRRGGHAVAELVGWRLCLGSQTATASRYGYLQR